MTSLETRTVTWSLIGEMGLLAYAVLAGDFSPPSATISALGALVSTMTLVLPNFCGLAPESWERAEVDWAFLKTPAAYSWGMVKLLVMSAAIAFPFGLVIVSIPSCRFRTVRALPPAWGRP